MNEDWEAYYLRRREEQKAARDKRAVEFLSTRLQAGPVLVPALKMEVKRTGLSWASVRLARHVLGAWSLPSDRGQVWGLEQKSVLTLKE